MSAIIHTSSAGGVNTYLLRTAAGFILIDTGFANQRAAIMMLLSKAGCVVGQLRLIVLTHGDADHAGSAAYLRDVYGAPIAIHPNDVGMVQTGDMRWGRQAQPDQVSPLFRLFQLFDRTPPLTTFQPDLMLAEGDRLDTYGLAAQVICLPGHSSGSIGILTDDGDLFCGDLLMYFRKPRLQMYIDDLAAAQASLARLRALPVHTVYPGLMANPSPSRPSGGLTGQCTYNKHPGLV